MAAFRSAASKAVHLKVYPRPATLSESRELLHVLQQFGEVTMFKSLRVRRSDQQCGASADAHMEPAHAV